MDDKYLEQQFTGNYVRLVNQVRELQGELAVKNNLILQLQQQLLAEQNKKAVCSDASL